MSHAIERAAERYGIALTSRDIREAKRQIKEGRAVAVKKRLNGAVSLVSIRGTTLAAMYDDKLDKIVTFYSQEQISRRNRRQIKYRRPWGKATARRPNQIDYEMENA